MLQEFFIRLVGYETKGELPQGDQVVGAEEVGEGLENPVLRVDVAVRALDNLDPATERLEKDRRLLGELGGTLLEVRSGDPASGLIEAARDAGACQLVIGSRHRWRLSRLLNGSTVTEQVLRAAGDLPVQVVNVGRPDKTSREWRRQHVAQGGTGEPETARSRPHADPADLRNAKPRVRSENHSP